MGYKIAIMGTGAVGAYAGAHMARNGENVTFIDPWPENVETMKIEAPSLALKFSAVLAAVAAASWLADGLPPAWPTDRASAGRR